MDKKQFEAKKAIIDKHRGLIDELMANIEKEYGESQLAEAEKPELRHGDVWDDEILGLIVILEKTTSIDNVQRGEHRQSDKDGVFPNSAESHSASARHFLFNIFDDRKALSEPLKGNTFYLGDAKFSAFSGSLHMGGAGKGYPVEIGLERLPELILNLRRLLHTAKQEQDKERRNGKDNA